MHFRDLDTECQIARGPRVRAVGWLAAGHEFPQGDVDPAAIEKLEELVEDGWVHVAAAGTHECDLCAGARESRNILVPAGDVLYVAPAMIVHYIADHSYRPPDEFTSAVLACPTPMSDAYYEALRSFIDVFSVGHPMTAVEFHRFTHEHREHRARLAAARRAEAGRKRFRWD